MMHLKSETFSILVLALRNQRKEDIYLFTPFKDLDLQKTHLKPKSILLNVNMVLM